MDFSLNGSSDVLGMGPHDLLLEIPLMEPRHRLGCHLSVTAVCDGLPCVLFEHIFKNKACKFLEEGGCEHPDIINLINKEK